METGDGGGVVVVGRVEIDTRAPFRSVKEAVTLFGEKVLVGEIYANRIKEMKAQAGESGKGESKIAALTAELVEIKQSLQKAQEENNSMSYSIKTLREDLEQKKKELQQLKARELHRQRFDPDIEDLKFIENKTMTRDEEPHDQFQKKRYVKFASPPSLTQVIANKDNMPEKTDRVMKLRRKTFIPIIGWLFPKKKASQEDDHHSLRANEVQRHF
ncbi:WEB family protein At3g51220-like [Hibiscus syriacus]|uniref:WEB family protein At3g51220-like n=1 Tax=Hibiscus syriacus TaxID=106335 RepID=UPI001921A4B8|nr:WEB family protein At3g51220-like [Hibiscus syriacus]